jgi:hypothetical protein
LPERDKNGNSRARDTVTAVPEALRGGQNPAGAERPDSFERFSD